MSVAAGPALPRAIRIGRPLADTGELGAHVHPDKAISQRATVLAALAEGESRIGNLADGLDTAANLQALAELGVPVRRDGRGRVAIRGGDLHAKGLRLDAGNSATTARLLVATLAGTRCDAVVTGNALLSRRPMSWLVDPLREMGAGLQYLGAEGCLPIAVTGRPLRGATVRVEVASAQPVSALLFAGTLASGPVVIHRRTAARDHTERLLRFTGIQVRESERTVEVEPGRPQAFELDIPGDPSAAAFLAALHLVSPRAASPLRIEDVCVNPRRTGFFRVLERMGAVVEAEMAERPGPEPVGALTVRLAGTLRGTDVRGPELIQATIDEIPLLAALAALGDRDTRIRDVGELRDKDTDRLRGTVELLEAFGVLASASGNELHVAPGLHRAPHRLALPPDHRLIFAGLVLALASGGDIELEGVEAAAVSHPGVVADIARYAEMVPLR